ncbi:LIM homeobox transcription factor 1-beta [Portunus trituberculatus]|uniref:LIM homeobox transcription factor 1-beta n=1 Tax=Portunus trituberculatus TaxID=210409 RepID=A0A5B7DFX2_PORTR|nr:LIM homeobox transcription factor 1-beta [Portunus trituberculatus]
MATVFTIFIPDVMKPMALEMCEGCGRTIHDRFIMRVIDTSWHEDCLVCCVCRVQLQHSCFARDSKIYCKLDYDSTMTRFHIHSAYYLVILYSFRNLCGD